MEATLWPYGKCEKCANKNYCAWSQNEILNCMNNRYQNFSPMRNADRIRAMSDEELAEWFTTGVSTRDICPPKHGFELCIEGKCKNCWLAWLKQEVGDGQTP